MEHYLSKLPKQQASPFEQPKGINKVFVKLFCRPPTFLKLFSFVGKLPIAFAYILVSFCYITVPAWLWLLRKELLEHAPIETLALHAVCGLIMFLAADFIWRRHAIQKYSKKTAITAASITSVLPRTTRPLLFTDSSSLLSSSSKSVAQAAGDQLAGPVMSINADASQVKPGNPALERSMSRAHSSKHSADWHAARGSVMRLHAHMYGEELAEGILPHAAITQRAAVICTELGVQWPTTGTTDPKIVLGLLHDAERVLGLFEDAQ